MRTRTIPSSIAYQMAHCLLGSAAAGIVVSLLLVVIVRALG